MRNPLQNLKISQRMALAIVIPILGLLVFSGLFVLDKYGEAQSMARLQRLAALAPVASAVVHELQKERGMSAGFISSRGGRFADTLRAQRGLTEAALKRYETFLTGFDAQIYGAALTDLLEEADDALANLTAKRAAVDGLRLSVPDMAAYYTATIHKLLDIDERMSVLSENAAVTNAIVAYTALLQSKERAGLERAMGATGFSAGVFKPAIHQRFLKLIAKQESYLEVFRMHASAEQIAFLEATLAGRAVTEVEEMRGIAIDSFGTNAPLGIEGPYWFETITKKIELLKKVEDRLAADLLALAADIEAANRRAFLVVGSLALLLLGITLVLAVMIARGITRPLSNVTRVITALAEGQAHVDVSHTDRGDEIGNIARAVGVFQENAQEVMRLREEQARSEERAAMEKREAMERLAGSFESTVKVVVDSVSSASAQMESNARFVSTSADQTQEQASTVAAASEQASSNVETVAAATEELSASIGEISRQVAESSRIATEAVQEAERTNTQVRGLVDAASNVGDVVNLISDIAEQTNLLALNATIEAARAGDAGKGFAVVASEVKTLATQTAKATEEISQQIGAIQAATGEAATAIEGIGSVVTKINEIAAAIAAAIEEQGAATEEIARNVQEAAKGTKQVSGTIVSVNDAAAENGRSAREMLDATTQLTREAAKLATEVDHFLERVRAA